MQCVTVDTFMNVLIPQGIGDAIWAIHKLQDLTRKKGDGTVHVYIACFGTGMGESRALEFTRRFGFVKTAEMYIMPRIDQQGAVLLPGIPADEKGYYRYIPDGVPGALPGIDYVLMPNAALERGVWLERWLPEIETNWDVMSDFQFIKGELDRAEDLRRQGEYVVFFLGSEGSNTTAGHNRGGIWKPEDWIDLGRRIKEELGFRIIVVGEKYDESYFSKYIKGRLDCLSLIGRTGVGDVFAITKKSRFVISYQSGVGIVSSYFGVPTGIFWRAKGDSISSDSYVSLDEAMASAWVNPWMISQEKHLPLIYGRHDVQYIMEEVKRRQW